MLRATCSSSVKRCATSARWRCEAAAHTRKGTSLATSTTINPSPQGSCVVLQGGGAAKPVAQGDRARSSKPLGAIRNTRPIAKAVWGTASIGPNTRTRRDQPGPGKPRARMHAAKPTDKALEATPVQTLSASAARVWWSATSARQAPMSLPAIMAAQAASKRGSPARTISNSGHAREVSLGRPCHIASGVFYVLVSLAACPHDGAQEVPDVLDLGRMQAVLHRIRVPLNRVSHA